MKKYLIMIINKFINKPIDIDNKVIYFHGRRNSQPLKKIGAMNPQKPYYTAKPVRYERDNEGEKLDHIEQVDNPEEAEFWSVYKYEQDDAGLMNPVCISDFYAVNMEINAKKFAEMKNNN